MKLEVKPATDDDYVFAHHINKENMESYIDKYWGGWNENIYRENYEKRENFIVYCDSKSVGYFAIKMKPNLVYLDDMYVKSLEQSKGIGSQILQQIETIANERKCGLVRLRVF